MADVFCQHGLSTGSNDGTTWSDAYQSAFTFWAALAADDVGHIKEHAGIDCSGAGFSSSVDHTVHCGYTSSLTGTTTGSAYQTGTTVFSGGASYRCFTFTGDSLVTHAEFTGFDFPGHGPIVSLANTVLELQRCLITTCSPGSSFGSAIYLGSSSTLIGYRTRFTNCNGIWGPVSAGATSAVIDLDRCRIDNNTATTGGAIYSSAPGVTLVNTVVDNNEASGNGGAFVVQESTSTFTGCTVVDNNSTGTPYGGFYFGKRGYVYNTVAWGNTGTTGDGHQIRCGYSSSQVYNCCVQDLTGDGLSGTSNTTGSTADNPQFEGSGNDPYSLTASSPTSVTEGASTAHANYTTYDYLGETRHASIGAYEYVSAAGGSDTLTGGTYNYSGSSLNSLTSYSDSLQGGSYSYTGSTLNSQQGFLDTLTGGVYSYMGNAVVSLTNWLDTLQGGTYAYVGSSLNAYLSRVDALLPGSYLYTGSEVLSLLNKRDILQAGTYLYTGADIVVTAAGTDILQGGVYRYVGADLQSSGALLDFLEGGVFNYTGIALETALNLSDTLQGGNYAYTGSELVTSLSLVDVLTGGIYTYTGIELASLLSRIDNLQGGSYVYSGADINTTQGLLDVLSGGSYTYTGSPVTSTTTFVDVLVGGVYQYTGAVIVQGGDVNVLPVIMNINMPLSEVVNDNLNPFQQTIFGSDLENVFLNTSEFGQTVNFYHSGFDEWEDYAAIFDDPSKELSFDAAPSAVSEAPQLILSERKLKHTIVRNDRCRVAGRTYWVDDFEKDGVGSVVVFLRTK